MCNKMYTAKRNLVRHAISSHSDVKFSCKFCPNIYKRKDNLNKHIRTKHQNVIEVPNQQVENDLCENTSDDEVFLNINDTGIKIFISHKF